MVNFRGKEGGDHLKVNPKNFSPFLQGGSDWGSEAWGTSKRRRERGKVHSHQQDRFQETLSNNRLLGKKKDIAAGIRRLQRNEG